MILMRKGFQWPGASSEHHIILYISSFNGVLGAKENDLFRATLNNEVTVNLVTNLLLLASCDLH